MNGYEALFFGRVRQFTASPFPSGRPVEMFFLITAGNAKCLLLSLFINDFTFPTFAIFGGTGGHDTYQFSVFACTYFFYFPPLGVLMFER